MTDTDPSHPVDPIETTQPSPPAAEPETAEPTAENGADAGSDQKPRRRILIGSQRDPAAYRPKPIPVVDTGSEKSTGEEKPRRRRRRGPRAKAKTAETGSTETAPAETAPTETAPTETAPTEIQPSLAPPADRPETPATQETSPVAAAPVEVPPEEPAVSTEPVGELDRSVTAVPAGRVPLPNLRERLPDDLEDEFNQALGDAPVEELMAGDDAATSQELLEPESRHTGRVVVVQRDDVFVELGGREQGCIPVKQFDDQPPEPGTTLEVMVQRFNTEEGLYDLSLPDAAVVVDDWDDINEGMLVEARVTGHNTGGLECEVNQLRGFIPISQIDLYRVEDLAQFADQKFHCLVTEANPERRNLVLSRRAVLEREKEEARQEFINSIEPGQIYEGVVRKLVEFGAFVDIGGIDGLLHVSQLAWGRVNHPSEVLTDGQKIKVKIEKFDRESGRLSLAYRDMLENPWDGADKKYPENSILEGTVTKLMEFGAFVEMEPGVEGLVHISELSHKRVWRASDVVKEGEKAEVMVLSVNTEAQRMSLSIKQVHGEPEPKKEDRPESEAPLPPPRKRQQPSRPLQGGLGRVSDGDRFGLKW